MMMKKNHEKLSENSPGPLLVINDKGGEVGSIKSVHDLLCLAETGGTGFPNPVAPGFGSSALSLYGKLSGTEFPKPVAPILAVGCSRPM
jgi:hypothetical protein